ncbi:osmoprotectant transport system ATP-binding protein [Oceanisphaera litoralis]|uniref:ABC transporter ATP-binding protein n=1 Tax=Oceanisphaera litoralis TaxID=225144 RepID=UPI001958FE7F|nr:ABC transporter ATP-binding protein [Oceanisphaera litoralis]MBM7456020.1 osmoprotectant transport system ATP-binding protein [Oceanisphaera litoralis]
MIEVKALSKQFGAQLAVDNLSFRVERGQFCMLVGTSGCGKSTTLRMINRLIEPSQGQILINEQDVTTLPPEQLRRRIGYVIQGVGLFPHRTIHQNIATVPRLLGWKKADIDARVTELLTLFRLDAATFAGKYPHQLSGGEQQRVGVARALAARPELLLMDEPFGALDPLTRALLQDELLRVQKLLGITIIMVTHDLEEAVKMADVIAVMDKGELLQLDNPETLLRHPRAGLVQNLVGGLDRSLRLLAIKQVGQVMTPLSLQQQQQQQQQQRPSSSVPTIAADANLRDAMALLIWEGVDCLRVVDTAGKHIGQVTMPDLLQQGARA